MITKIRKRDGRLVDYDISKIENAIAKAMMSLGDGEIKDCKKMAKITELYLTEKFEDKIPSVEDIQDIVENVLMRNGYEDVAKAYIIYRRDHEKIRNINNTFNCTVFRNLLTFYLLMSKIENYFFKCKVLL